MSTPDQATLQEYLLHPHTPLVFRSGKPFRPAIRDEPQFPSPAAWAGLMRTCLMDDRSLPPESRIPESLLAVPAHGVLLVRHSLVRHSLVKHSAESSQLYIPRPADAYLTQDEDTFLRMTPRLLPQGHGSDLDDRLRPVMLDDTVKNVGKERDSALFWSMQDYVHWASGHKVVAVSAETSGLPQVESRVHVRIDRRRDAAEDGQIFRTEGWDCGQKRSATGFDAHHWCFVGRGPKDVAPQLVAFGGERRLSWLAPSGASLMALNADLRKTLVNATGIAVTFATPAIFSHGWRPGWLDEKLTGSPPGLPELSLTLVAVSLPWWQNISGWDLRHRRSKDTRRAVPAGATYWFKVKGEVKGDASVLWLRPLSDAEQDRRDGFGLALVRPWQPEQQG